jgi:hypothetical protein
VLRSSSGGKIKGESENFEERSVRDAEDLERASAPG